MANLADTHIRDAQGSHFLSPRLVIADLNLLILWTVSSSWCNKHILNVLKSKQLCSLWFTVFQIFFCECFYLCIYVCVCVCVRLHCLSQKLGILWVCSEVANLAANAIMQIISTKKWTVVTNMIRISNVHNSLLSYLRLYAYIYIHFIFSLFSRHDAAMETV